jgi:two-component system chemotaxis response regulator CheB
MKAAEIAEFINQMNTSDIEKGMDAMTADQEKAEIKRVANDMTGFEQGADLDNHTILVCPECGGTLWEFQEGKRLHYRCHTGHRYSEETLEFGQNEMLERAIWTAIRIMEERASFIRRMINRAKQNNQALMQDYFENQASALEQHAEQLKKFIASIS